MQLLKFTIAAGETKQFEIGGRFIEIVESDAAINLLFFDANGSQVDDAVGAVSGLFIEGQFKLFQVFSATAQFINLLITDGRGGSRRQPGNVRIINRVSASCRQLVQANTAIADEVVQVVAPAANLSGVVVRSIFAAAQPGMLGVCSVQVFAAPVPPATGAAAEMTLSPFVLISRVVSNDPAVLGQRLDMGQQIEIPAGWGLYIGRISTVAATASSVRLSYEISM